MTLRSLAIAASAVTALLPSCANDPITRTNAATSSASKIARDSRAALKSLYAQNTKARLLGREAKGVLVFPAIVERSNRSGLHGTTGFSPALVDGLLACGG